MSDPRKPLHARHEAFCRYVAEGCSETQAAQRAGFPPVDAAQRGAELLSRADIQTRIGELAAEGVARMKALRARTLARLDAIHDKAIESGQISLALRVAIAIANLGGLDGAAAQRSRPLPSPATARTRLEVVAPEQASQLSPHSRVAVDRLLDVPSPQPGLGRRALARRRGTPAGPRVRHPAATRSGLPWAALPWDSDLQ